MNWQETYAQWQAKEDLDPELKSQLNDLQAQEREDRFYRYLEFGTGGMRGELGVGTNRINHYTIKRMALGLAQYLLSTQGSQELSVVIAYDNRHKSDDFASLTAQVLASQGIKVYLSDEMRPTPQLSFLVRHLGADAGVMITASHNPAAYNGFKVYNESGGQITLEAADEITAQLALIPNELTIETDSLTSYLKTRQVQMIGVEADQAYLTCLKTVSQNQELLSESGHQLSIVYTPLHGAGQSLVSQGLQQAGLTRVKLVREQADGDSDFSTVSSPNPEEAAAFTQAMALGAECQADLLLATDPDADRLGVAVRNPVTSSFELLTGNQLGAIMLHYLLQSKAKKESELSHYFLAKTIVTSDLGEKMAASYGVKTVNTLTGFKFIGEQILLAEKDKTKQFLFGYEESYGYLIKPFVRDKDAIQAAVLLGEIALDCQLKGQTLLDLLEAIYQEFGYYHEALQTLTFKGQRAERELREKMQQLRQRSIKQIGTKEIVTVEDYWLGKELVATGEERTLTLPQADVIKYTFADGSWACIRPSGTEPKCKFYFSTVGKNAEEAAQASQELASALLTLFGEL